VDIKINGSGLPKGPKYLKVSLPKNLKMVWPDLKDHLPVSYYGTSWFTTNIASDLQNLKIHKQDRILDIGAFENQMVKKLHNNGYYNAIGIDVNPEIRRHPYGMKINFRDLSLKRKYCVILFNHLLENFPGGMFNNLMQPSLQLLANKIYFHLLSKGYLIFCDYEDNVPTFKECLINIGFKHILEQDKYSHIFQKD